MEDRFRIGVITATHGLKGEVKVFPTTDDPDRFADLTDVILAAKDGEHHLSVAAARRFRQYMIVRFHEFTDISQIEPYVRCELYVTRENAVELGENEYYIADLIGLAVKDEQERRLGTITDVLQTGANDVYVITGEEQEILLPAIRQCVLKVDLAEGVMHVHLLKGLSETGAQRGKSGNRS